MTNDRPCKLSAMVLLSLPSAPFSVDELSQQLETPKATLRIYLYRWEHDDHVIQRNEIINGSPTYILTEYGKECLRKLGKIRQTATSRVLNHV